MSEPLLDVDDLAVSFANSGAAGAPPAGVRQAEQKRTPFGRATPQPVQKRLVEVEAGVSDTESPGNCRGIATIGGAAI